MAREARKPRRRGAAPDIDWRDVIAISADWYWEQDAELRFTYFSDAELKAAGLAPTRFLGKRRWETPYHGVSEAAWAAHRAQLARREPFRDFVIGRYRDDGSESFNSISGRPRFDAQGRFLGYRGISRDVTALVLAERGLRESEARYRELTEMSPAAIYVHVDGILRYVNPATLRLFEEARPEAMLGRPLLDYIHPLERGEVLERMRRTRDEGAGFPATTRRFVRRDGTQFVAEVTVVPHTFAGQRGGMAVVRDVTEILEAQRRLAESEERYRLLVETSPDAVFLLSAGRIAFLNRSGAALYGAEDPAQLVGTPILEHVHAEDRALVQERMRALMQDLQPVAPTVIRQLRLDGSSFYGEVVSRPFPVAGQPGALTLVRDVTERRRAEERILALNALLEARVRERTRQLEDASRELEALSYSVSHDLRAPLRAVQGFSELLERQAGGALDDKARHYLARMQEAGRRMGLLIDDLLDLSRVTQAPLEPVALDLSALAAQVVEDLRASEPQRAVEVVIAPGLAARGDRALVRRLLQNLLENAWKFTRKREGARIEVGEALDGRRRAIFVRDNGAGFDMRQADKLFGAFQRLHTDEEFPGTGIGLATVQRIIARHGGRVWAEGTPGQGAAFYFSLPSEPVPAPDAGV